jgi:hypothetical protein
MEIFPFTSILYTYLPAPTNSGTSGLRVKTRNTSVSPGRSLRTCVLYPAFEATPAGTGPGSMMPPVQLAFFDERSIRREVTASVGSQRIDIRLELRRIDIDIQTTGIVRKHGNVKRTVRAAEVFERGPDGFCGGQIPASVFAHRVEALDRERD